MRAEEKRQQARGKSKTSTSSRATVDAAGSPRADKLKLAERTEKVLSRRRAARGLPPVAHAAGVASGKRPSRAGRLRNLSRPQEPIRQDSRRAGPQRIRPGDRRRRSPIMVYIVGLSFDKVCLLLQFFQNLRLKKSQADALLESIVAALARRVRRAVHAAGQLAGGACRRNELEHQQRVGVSVGEGARAVFRRAQGCATRCEQILDPDDVRRHW